MCVRSAVMIPERDLDGVGRHAYSLAPSHACTHTQNTHNARARTGGVCFARIWKDVSGLREIPNIGSLGRPTMTVETDSLNYDNGAFQSLGLVDNFVLRWTGTVEIKAGGYYSFHAKSDDGSKVYINDELVVDHDGIHGASEKSATVSLSQGLCPLVVDYFERGGGAEEE